MISGTSSAPANGAIAKEMPPLPVVPPDLYGSSSSFSSDAGKWEESLKKVVPAIVVIRVCLCSAFDGDRASYSHATGFVVDKVRGIILTNRHVVTPGPSVADAIFMNKEEVDLTPIYYDPVHDFSFLRFDPKAVKFMEIAEVSLNPEGAKVGVDIRVVGNDSGEKLSILPGILARLDRAAPDYDGPYSDFNTFYLAAASSTSGGSSGSPVLTADGKAVALNCGAQMQTAAAFYLPLTKVARALDLIQRGVKVTRGTVQTILVHTGFDEARRLGLAPDTEATLRKEFPEETGVLVVNQVIPKGPADDILEPGDIVVRMNGKLITTFLPWEAGLDEAVGGEVEMQVQRGAEEVTVTLTVGDLYDITPREYLSASSGVIHAVSYQQAKKFNVPVEGVFIAQTGHMFHRARLDKRSLIISIGSDATPDLDACEAALCKHADGARVSVRFKRLSDIHRTATAVITMDRKWFPMQRVRHNASDGLWHSTPSPLPPPTPPQPLPALPPVAADGAADGAYLDRHESAASGGISSSLVMVTFSTPHLVDGVESMSVADVGVVVDAEFGLVVVDRTTVQVALGDVMLTFNGSEEVTARPIFVHPIHNFSVVQFDPSAVKGVFTAAVLSSRETEDGESNGSSSSGSRGGGGGGVDKADERAAAAAAPVATVAEAAEEERNGGNGTAVLANGASSSSSSCAKGGREGLPSPPPLQPGDAADFHGLTSTNAPVRQRTVVVKLERLLLKTCDSPQFTPHSVEVLQFDQMSSSMAGVFVAAAGDKSSPSSSCSSYSATAASTGGGDAKTSCPPPVVLAFWLSFSYSERNHRYYSMHGLPAPVVSRAVARIRRDLQAQKLQKKRISVGVLPAAAAAAAAAVVPGEVGGSKATAAAAAEAAAELAESAAGSDDDGGRDESSVPGTRVGIGLDGAKESLGAAPCLPVELVTVGLSKARAGLGLSEVWSRKIEDKCGKRQKQVLEVRRCLAGTPAFSVLETGDIILTVDGKLVTNFREVEVEVEDGEGSPVQLTILRDLEEQEVTVIPSYLPTRETDRLFMWAGMMVQTPHLAILQLGFLPKEGGGVYASRWYGGSPANKYMLGNHNWIVEVNGVPTPTLDAFLIAVKDIGHKSPVRVKTVDLTSKVEVTTLRTDHHYWPTLELRHSEEGWTRTKHAGPNPPKLLPANGNSGGYYTTTPQESREE